MIVSALTIVSGVIIWVGSAVSNVWKTKEARIQTTEQLSEKYCPPVNTLPDNMPTWKIDIYKVQCQGVERRVLP